MLFPVCLLLLELVVHTRRSLKPTRSRQLFSLTRPLSHADCTGRGSTQHAGVIMHRLFGYLAMGALLFPLRHSLRKRLPVLSTWGRLRTWLTVHEAVGLAGAAAIVIQVLST